MLYAYLNENGILCATAELANVPEQFRSKVVVFETLNLGDHDKLYVEAGQIKLKTEEMILNEMKNNLLDELKQKTYNLLAPTDWIVIKCLELRLDIKTTYPEIKAKRDLIRQKNNDFENAIKKGKTIDELNKIKEQIDQWI
ncbi:MAG: hypothetical protein QXJ20_02700 [Candidatus Aenigmatarchaeota archaeon]